jgi:DUF218 domain-containing protein
VPTTLVVFGRGLELDETGAVAGLNEPSRARVQAVLDHVAAHADLFRRRADGGERGRVVFSGGWAGAAAGLAPPPESQREARLMAELAAEADVAGDPLSRYVDVAVEVRSDSTLENVLQVRELGLLADQRFDADHPLGLVTHREHLARITYFVRKILDLPADALVPVLARGPDGRSRHMPEPVLHAVTRAAFFGARDAEALRRRERALVVGGRRAAKLTSAARSRPRSGPTPT